MTVQPECAILVLATPQPLEVLAKLLERGLRLAAQTCANTI